VRQLPRSWKQRHEPGFYRPSIAHTGGAVSGHRAPGGVCPRRPGWSSENAGVPLQSYADYRNPCISSEHPDQARRLAGSKRKEPTAQAHKAARRQVAKLAEQATASWQGGISGSTPATSGVHRCQRQLPGEGGLLGLAAVGDGIAEQANGGGSNRGCRHWMLLNLLAGLLCEND